MKKDYDHPNPMPDDLFIQTGIPIEHGYFILGTKGTGTHPSLYLYPGR